jgi:aspartyl-tRNA(Asn)/glutamyl-tRNA(Gln) amidotransferase subunit C
MQITPQLIDHLAKLSYLSFTETEKQALIPDMEKMIAMVDNLKEVNVDGVEPLLHVFSEENNVRMDFTKTHLSQAEINAFAPNKHENYFVVPQVIAK